MAYGFRLFETELLPHHRRKVDAVPWLLPDGSHYGNHAAAYIAALVGQTQRLPARPGWNDGRGETSIPVYQTKKNDKVVRWTSVHQRTVLHLSAAMLSGTVGSHSDGIGQTTAHDTALTDLAPGNEYRIELLFPHNDGRGLLVVETHGTGCPVEAIPRWLTVLCDITQGTPAEDSADPNLVWKLAANPLIDRAHLEDMLMNGEKVELGLKGATPSGSGISSGSPVRLQIDVDIKARQALLQGMLQHLQGQTKNPNDLLKAVQLDDTLGDLDFRDGSLRVQNTAGETKTVWLSQMSEIFTYPTTKDLPPNPQAWREAVREKVHAVRPDLEWSNEWPGKVPLAG